MRWLPLVCLLAVAAVAAPAQKTQSFDPPPPTRPSDDKLQAIAAKAERLEGALTVLRNQGVRDPAMADMEVYLAAARRIVDHNEFFHKDAADWTLAALDRGLLRASQQAMGERPWYFQRGRAVVRGYRSALDGTVQPY